MSEIAFDSRDSILSLDTPPQSPAPTTARSERTDGTAVTPTTDSGHSDSGASRTDSEAPDGAEDQSTASELDSSGSEYEEGSEKEEYEGEEQEGTGDRSEPSVDSNSEPDSSNSEEGSAGLTDADFEGEGEGTSSDREEKSGSPSTNRGHIVAPSEPDYQPEAPRRLRTPRTWQHEMARLASLYVFPVLLAIPLSLILHLNVVLLTPLYNSLPLTLHTPSLYVFHTIPPTVIYWYATLHCTAKDVVSARVCFSLIALSGDLVVICGRRVGSLAGRIAGPEWGAWGARAGMGMGAVAGSTMFALLCFDYISPVAPVKNQHDRVRSLLNILIRSVAYTAHVYLGERIWRGYLSGGSSILATSPEKSILFISLILTALSLVVRPSASKDTFPAKVNSFLAKNISLSSKSRANLARAVSFLPRHALPALLLLRLPLIIVTLRQQIYLRPPGAGAEPYVTAHGELRMLSSEQSLTGRIVVGDNLKDGYRFLRCDHSILGGRWIREKAGKEGDGKSEVEMGDSIFATFNLQEVAVLAHRSDPAESLVKTLALTTDLDVMLEGDDENEEGKVPDRALIIGLGAGIAAQGFAKRGLQVDIVEIDPSVYTAAATYFDLPPPQSANIMDGASFISQLAGLARTNTTDPSVDEASLQALERLPKWSYIVQDCFTGGSVPGEMFTKEFWVDLGEVLDDDGIVAMNFAGLLRSKASKSVLVTLLSVFPQCRAFGDGFEANNSPNDLTNMVVFCTKTYSPLLTFRRPTSADVLRSPLRSHVYSTFHPHEIQLDSIVSDADHADPQMMLRRGDTARLAQWQQGTAMATWRAMQNILTPQMWLAY